MNEWNKRAADTLRAKAAWLEEQERSAVELVAIVNLVDAGDELSEHEVTFYTTVVTWPELDSEYTTEVLKDAIERVGMDEPDPFVPELVSEPKIH